MIYVRFFPSSFSLFHPSRMAMVNFLRLIHSFLEDDANDDYMREMALRDGKRRTSKKSQVRLFWWRGFLKKGGGDQVIEDKNQFNEGVATTHINYKIQHESSSLVLLACVAI